MPKFGHHHLHHRDDESSFSSARRSASRFSGKSNRLVDSLANDLSRAKTALTDAKIHERAIEEELMETRARERLAVVDTILEVLKDTGDDGKGGGDA